MLHCVITRPIETHGWGGKHALAYHNAPTTQISCRRFIKSTLLIALEHHLLSCYVHTFLGFCRLTIRKLDSYWKINDGLSTDFAFDPWNIVLWVTAENSLRVGTPTWAIQHLLDYTHFYKSKVTHWEVTRKIRKETCSFPSFVGILDSAKYFTWNYSFFFFLFFSFFLLI